MLDHSSIPEFSVTQISNAIKMLLEANFGIIKVRGEISGFKLATSGHAYFNLKEDLAVIGCTCWRPVMNKLEIVMEDGIEVIITGKISSYSGQSKYQLTVEKIEPAGVGAWMKILHARQEKLAKEGLFDKEHKKPLQFITKTIGHR